MVWKGFARLSPVDAKGDAAVWGSPHGQRVQEEAELVPCLFLAKPDGLKHALLDIPPAR